MCKLFGLGFRGEFVLKLTGEGFEEDLFLAYGVVAPVACFEDEVAGLLEVGEV
ncbi:MAG: hypothetical protein ACJAQT_002800 [Akkermansiaceae bacterium]|jgi:hypothetical protein